MSGPPARAAVASEIQQVGRVPRGAQLLSRLAPAARVVEPAVQRQDGGARRGGLVGVVHQLGAVGRGERGRPGSAGGRRGRSSAACAARRRISSRSPGNTRRTARAAVWTRAANHTVPTGFSGVPPPGPAIPVTAMVQSAEKRRCAPSAIARTVSSETAPYASRVSSGTLSAAVLITSAYATTPPMKVRSEERRVGKEWRSGGRR